MTCGAARRTTRTGKLLATTVGISAIATEKLGCDRPGCKKYLTRGPCSPIAVEMKMVPGTPVWAVVRFAISTTSSLASSSAKPRSAGIFRISSVFMVGLFSAKPPAAPTALDVRQEAGNAAVEVGPELVRDRPAI